MNTKDHWFAEAFNAMVERFPNRVCFFDIDGSGVTYAQMERHFDEADNVSVNYLVHVSNAALKLAEFMLNDGDRAMSMTERADAAQAKQLRDQVRALNRENEGLRADLRGERERLYPETSKNVADVMDFLQSALAPAEAGEVNELRRENDDLRRQLNEAETMLKEREIQFRKRMRIAIESVFNQEPSP